MLPKYYNNKKAVIDYGTAIGTFTAPPTVAEANALTVPEGTALIAIAKHDAYSHAIDVTDLIELKKVLGACGDHWKNVTLYTVAADKLAECEGLRAGAAPLKSAIATAGKH